MSGAGQASRGGLDPGDAAERGRQAHGAGAVAAQPHGRTAGRDEGRFAAAAAAGGPRQIVRVVRPSEQEVVGFKGKQQVGKVGSGDGDGAGRAQTGDQGGIVVRRGRRLADRTRQFDGILHAEGDAVEGARRLAARQGGIGSAGVRQCPRREQIYHGVQRGIHLRDPVEV